MRLFCVYTQCTNCGAESYLSAGRVVRAIGKPLTEHTAATISRATPCNACGSNKLDVYFPHDKTPIVIASKTPCCRICGNYIPEKLLYSFPLADFCPLCVADGGISASQIVAAYGQLAPVYGKSVAGEAYRFMALQLWLGGDDASRMKWLRKAVTERDSGAGQTLGDILSHSNDQTELSEAVAAYEIAVEETGRSHGEGYAERRLAEMLFHGKGCAADPERALALMLAAADKGNSTALSELGRLYFDGRCGLVGDMERAFDYYRRAYELSPQSMSYSAATALMLLQGIGTAVDEILGTATLRHSISAYCDGPGRVDRDVCFVEVMTALKFKEGQIADLPSARNYLDWMVKLRVAGATDLLNRCGGPLPPFQPRWELSLWPALPDNDKVDLWLVKSPQRDRLGQPTTLGQVEMLPNRRWIATTEVGVAVGDTFGSRKEAVEALAQAVECDAPYLGAR
ncbi:MAG: hypothetical protein ABSD74_14455 [Rhizomicrobium sp.]|jgi:hypothetical protein